MERISQRWCGVDVHTNVVVACLMVVQAYGQKHTQLRTCRTVTKEVLELLDWLKAAAWTHVALEATGVDGRPLDNLLEGHFEVLVVNAHHLTAGPGRKTDGRDAEWIADVVHHGLLTGRFIPAAPQRELRDLTRSRANLVDERARAVNRLQKTLEDTTLTVGDVATDIMGTSARALVEALRAGHTDPVVLADLARGRRTATRAPLDEALVGVLKPHHRFLLAEHLSVIETLDEASARVGLESAHRLDPPPDPGQPPAPQAVQNQAVEPSALHSATQDQEQDPPRLSWAHAIVYDAGGHTPASCASEKRRDFSALMSARRGSDGFPGDATEKGSTCETV
jgi:transposase